MIFAYDMPMTPVRGMALRRVRPADKDKLGFNPKSAERVWAWDPKKKTLQVFLKPDSFTARDHVNFKNDYGNRPPEEQWEIVIRGDMKSRYIRQFVDDAELFDGVGWVKLTK